MVNQNGPVNRNALILKIALFLNYLDKTSYTRLTREIQNYRTPDQLDILKLMKAGKFISNHDIRDLKHTCLTFAKTQDDLRFGILCIEFGFLTESNLKLALEEQQRLVANGKQIRIGELLIEAGMLSGRQKNLILQKQKIADQAKYPGSSHNSPEQMNMREIKDSNAIIFIQQDSLRAFIKKTDLFDDQMPLEDLTYLLEKNGIIYGIVEDELLIQFIESPKYKTMVFKIAQGRPPVDGIDAKIVYMFETDYLKAGNLGDDGTIDFKDRGDIPFVAQGDTLAEKIEPKQGTDGVNIFGEAISHGPAADLSFNLGKGVRLSKDKLKVIATTEGNPKLKPGGELSVNSAYFIKGDVDYNTGHIKFDKNVFITGSVKNGFRVEAIDVVAKNIDGGIIKAEGDIFVQNGIVESDLEAKGSIKAGFIHNSKTRCMGDLTVQKEIVDTDLLIEGSLNIPRGKLYSSTLCAKGGAKVYCVGSEKSNPSQITVGASLYIEKALQHIDRVIEKRQNLLEESTLKKNKIESQITEVRDKLTRLNGNDRSLKEQEELLEKHLARTINEIEVFSQKVKTSVKEKFTLKRLDQKIPPRPVLEVSGKIYSGNKISGRYASLVLSRNLSCSRIMEIENSNGRSNRSWEMIVSSL